MAGSKKKGGKMNEYAKKLFEFDYSYFGPNAEFDQTEESPDLYANNINSEENFCYALATCLFDNDFNVDEESWNALETIEKKFGKEVREKVLYNMFNRNHDT
jgi:hypothetical protein